LVGECTPYQRSYGLPAASDASNKRRKGLPLPDGGQALLQNTGMNRTRFAALLAEPVASKPEEFGQIMKTELAKYQKVVKLSGAKVD
jgi:hypothetical protein